MGGRKLQQFNLDILILPADYVNIFQRKQSRYSNSPFLPSGGVPQQTYRHPITRSSSANGPGSPQFNPPLLSNSRLGNIYSNTQVKTTHDNIFIICNIYIFLFLVFPFLNYCIWYIRYMYIYIYIYQSHIHKPKM